MALLCLDIWMICTQQSGGVQLDATGYGGNMLCANLGLENLYQDLMEVGFLKEVVHLNREVISSGSKSNEEDEEEVEKAMRQICGLGLEMGRMMQIHTSSSDQNLHSS
ncbi:uncharacterized protein A4U43_C03F14300 [Asparagus officinalis]|uniref:Uncharacterized protein n=1 Tax=Asparagus officinalis TaxID=4686 RepID=A0A5P1FF56_ASPOF|nr:uncharacterized protein A4U43_C03F14300 [Asparagus officinalis]